MFTKNSPTGAHKPGFVQRSDSHKRPPSILAKGTKVVGNLVSKGDIELAGRVEGDIDAREVRIYPGASVQGGVVAEVLNCEGSIEGTVRVNKLCIGSTGKVVGDVLHESLSIEAGACLEGTVRKREQDKIRTRPHDTKKNPVLATAQVSSGAPRSKNVPTLPSPAPLGS